MVIDTGNQADRKLDELVPVAHRVIAAVETVISGKPEAIRLAMTVLLAHHGRQPARAADLSQG